MLHDVQPSHFAVVVYKASGEYNYTFVPWDLSQGKPAAPALATWKSDAYNTFSATAAGANGMLYASDQFRGKGIKQLKNGEVSALPMAGLEGDVCDLLFVDTKGRGTASSAAAANQ